MLPARTSPADEEVLRTGTDGDGGRRRGHVRQLEPRERPFHQLGHESLRADFDQPWDFADHIRVAPAATQSQDPGRIAETALVRYLAGEEVLLIALQRNLQAAGWDDDFEVPADVHIERVEAGLELQVVVGRQTSRVRFQREGAKRAG